MFPIKDYNGNKALLKLSKTAFLCSRKVFSSAVLKYYDWAIAQREAGNYLISGFHSQLEKDVLHYLLNGTQPIILALARGLKEKIEPELQKAIDEQRLLVSTPFDKSAKRITDKPPIRITNLCWNWQIRLLLDMSLQWSVGEAIGDNRQKY